MHAIDLRSDTVTKPTPEMRQAMAEAEVGDDVLGDDPTIAALERRTAELLGKPAAVYVPSGTMANQVALRTHTAPGDEILMDANAHMYFYEAGAPAALSGVTSRLLPGVRGLFTADDVRAALRPRNVHFPQSQLLCVENTHNRGGGSVWPVDRLAEVIAAAREADLKTHLDGARLWNATAAAGVTEREYAVGFDSISVCFSKGLGAPVGSALVGSEALIGRARRFRKMFGGGMRQAGIIAAGALYALEHHRGRLTEDHANAKRLAEGIAAMPNVTVDLEAVETNMVYFDVPALPAADLADRLTAAGVWVLPTAAHTLRAVTSLEVSAEDIEGAIKAIGHVLAAI